MFLRDAKIGQRVILYCRDDGFGCVVYVDNRNSNALLEATVLEHIPDENAVVVGWKNGERAADGVLSDVKIDVGWHKNGFIVAQKYGGHVIVEEGPLKKDYGVQCPCGIHPDQCEYHRT